MAPEEESANRVSTLSQITVRSANLGRMWMPYFLFMSVSVTPFEDTFRLMMVALKAAGASRVEDTAFCTAKGPVSISVGTAFR